MNSTNGLGAKKLNLGNLVRATVLVGLGMGGGYLIRGTDMPNYHHMDAKQVVAYEKMEYQAMTPEQRDAVRDSYIQTMDGNLLKRVGGFFDTMYNAGKGVLHRADTPTEKTK